MITRNKKSSVDEDSSAPKPSGWYYADLTVAAVTVFGVGWIGMLYRAVFYVPGIAFAAVIIVGLCRKYYKYRLSKPLRIAAGVTRGVFYAIALVSLAVPTVMLADMPVLYPLQKAVYMKNYADPESIFGFLPDNIPTNAESYRVRFVPSFLQGEAYIQIEFLTDSAQLNQYREFAQNSGAKKETAHESYAKYIGGITGKEETPEAWEFPTEGSRYHAHYYIYPESGYFMLTW